MPRREDYTNKCLDCGKICRGVRCRSCEDKRQRGSGNHNWKGGTYKFRGYVLVCMPGHPRAYKDGYVRRAILVMEQKLGRPLQRGERVHHINGIKDDDRPENLEAMTLGMHNKVHKIWESPGSGVGYRSRTHCPQGHPYDEVNTYYTRGWRECRTCRREQRMKGGAK